MKRTQSRADWDWSDLSKEEIHEKIREASELAHKEDKWLTLDELNEKVDTLVSREACVATR